jgi:glycosyltransferase involved in cell wall biosynthesis
MPPTTKRGKLLFVTLMVPGLSTSGSSMRSGNVLAALAKTFDVYLLLVPLGSKAAHRTLPGQFAHLESRFRIAEDSARVLAPQFHPDGSVAADAGDVVVDAFVEEALGPWRHIRFDAVHIYRLPLAPFVRAFDGHLVRRFLDIDDIDSITSDRLADLYFLNGRTSSGENSRRYARVHRLREDASVRRFDGVFTCSREDAVTLGRLYQCRTFVLPNTVAIPRAARSKKGPALTILFVGSMDYHPNEDGALQLADVVLPSVRRSCQGPVQLLIVGNCPRDTVLALGDRPGVTVTGAVDSVTPYYRQATVAVVPLRAGGGTRIKILEAAAYRVPVVSTPVGAEGLEVTDGLQLLVGDTPEELARQCIRLRMDARLRARIVRNAYAWVKREHTAAALDRALAAAYRQAGVGGS